MKLYIDTSKADKSVVKLDGKIYEKSGKVGMAQYVLQMIGKALEIQGKDLTDIAEIEVNTGPGSFTGLRVGISVAQTLGWSLGVKVNGKDMASDTITINYE